MLEQLPREAVDPCPSLEVFRAGLDGALGSLGCCDMWRLVALRVAGGWRLMILEVPSNPDHSVNLWFHDGSHRVFKVFLPFKNFLPIFLLLSSVPD